jgi:hypothetical protein
LVHRRIAMAATKKVTTPAELAETFHTEPKLVRKFLRSTTPRDQQPGRGHRWVLPAGKREMNRLQKQFDTWREAHTRHPAA